MSKKAKYSKEVEIGSICQKITVGRHSIPKKEYLLYILHEKLKLSAKAIFLFFLALFLVMIPWAVYTGVWQDIDYSLSSSYAVWMGDICLGISNFFIVHYYELAPKSFSKHTWKKHYILILFFSFLFSFMIHGIFLMDTLHGWTEVSATEGWSILGYYHIVIFALEFSIVINFFLHIGNIYIWGRTDKVYEKYTIVALMIYGFYVVYFLTLYINIWVFTVAKFSIEHEVVYLKATMTTLVQLPIYVIVLPLIFYTQSRMLSNGKEPWIKELRQFDMKVLEKIGFSLFFLFFLIVVENIVLLHGDML